MTHPAPAVIGWFDGTDYDFLSNFHPSPIRWAGATVATAEHAFQAAKATTRSAELWIAHASSPAEAKHLGRTTTLRSDWEAIKYGVMRQVLALKFAPGSDLADQLLATGDAMLIEGNSWNDRVWGQVDGVGENWLGHLLMARRAELRAALLS